MRRLALAFVFLFIPQVARAVDFDEKTIDDVVERAMKEFQVPGAAVVIVKDDEVLYLKGFGVREKGKPAKVTPNTVFPIASCTKAFTSTAIAMLVADGKLSWDDKVRTHLDYFRLSDELADRDVTIRDLLCHRTGMPRHDMLWAGQNIDSDELIRRWGKGTPSTPFRSMWEYSNVPFTTAGVIAGRLEKSNWATTIERRIFTPLEMKSSSCTAAAGQAAPEHVTPHYFGFDKSVNVMKWDEVDQAGGAGCINSTATDLGNWLRFQLAEGKLGNKRLVSTRALHETHFPQMLLRAEGIWALYFPAIATRFTSYGLGWFVHDYRGFGCVSHGGTLTGIRAQCMMIPERKIGVFVLSNLRPSLFPEAVAKSTLDHLLGLSMEDWVTFSKNQLMLYDFNTAVRMTKREADRKLNTKPSLPLKGYTGSFIEPAYGRAIVSVEDDKLVIHWGRYKFRLEHYHFDTWTAIPVEPTDEAITFDRITFDVLFRMGTSGEVEGVRFLDQEFRKVKGK